MASPRSKKVIKSKLDKEKEYIKNLMEDLDMETTTERAAPKRIYKGEVEIDHDLFKLEVSNMRKNISINEEAPVYAGVEHCHFYHSYDSSGKKQVACAPIAGHTHLVEMYMSEDGTINAKVGPAVVKQGGKYVPFKHDSHTHDATYMRSERITVRQVNAEATKAYDQAMAKMTGLND